MAEWLTPITDRTEADTVEAFNNQMIEEHLKGALNYSDLNRIENNYKYLVENLQKNGYYINHKYRNYTETEPVVTAIEVPGEPGASGGIVEPYLTSVGSANYVDTGFAPNSNTRVVIDVRLDTAGSGGMYFFGCRESGSSGRFMLFTNGADIGFGYDTNVTLINTITVGKRYTIDFNKNALTFDGQTTSLPASTFKNTRTFYLFNENMAGTLNKGLNFTLYSCQIYDNGTLIRDFIPKLDDSGVACLYDKVNDKYYYNAGSGSFTYGENVYSPVEYIESSGTQYIDPGISIPKSQAIDLRVECDCEWINPVGDNGVGSVVSGNIFWFGCYNNTIYYGNGTTDVTLSYKYTGGRAIWVLDAYNKEFSVSGIVSQTGISFKTPTVNGTFPIPARGNGIRIYGTKIYKSGSLIRDFIPWVDESGTVCLKDKVSNTYYYNAGSGTFNAGAPIGSGGSEPTIEYEVEYVQNTYTEWFEQNLPWLSEINRIRDNFNNLIKEYLAKSNIKTINKNQYFKFNEANKMEDISAYTKDMNEKMEYHFIKCGEVNSGGERLL